MCWLISSKRGVQWASCDVAGANPHFGFGSETAPKQRNSGTFKAIQPLAPNCTSPECPRDHTDYGMFGHAQMLRRLKAPMDDHGARGLCFAASQLSFPPSAPCGPWLLDRPGLRQSVVERWIRSTADSFILVPSCQSCQCLECSLPPWPPCTFRFCSRRPLPILGAAAYGSWWLRESRTGAPRCFNPAG